MDLPQLSRVPGPSFRLGGFFHELPLAPHIEIVLPREIEAGDGGRLGRQHKQNENDVYGNSAASSVVVYSAGENMRIPVPPLPKPGKDGAP